MTDVFAGVVAPDCPDCHAPAGCHHDRGCSVERCAACGWQRITCGCADTPPTVWTGAIPGQDEVERWRLPDLNAFGVLAARGAFRWNRDRQRWEPAHDLGAAITALVRHEGNIMPEQDETQTVLDDVAAIAADETADPQEALTAIRERLATGTKDTRGRHAGAPKSGEDLETK